MADKPIRRNEPITLITWSVIAASALASYGVVKAVREARALKAKASAARYAQLQRVVAQHEAESEIAAQAQIEAAQYLPLIALAAGAAGLAWALSP